MATSIVTTMQEFVGRPTTTWNKACFSITTKDSKCLRVHDLANVFFPECTIFVGDSLNRRAMGTLHFVLKHYPEISSFRDFTHVNFSEALNIPNHHGFNKRDLPLITKRNTTKPIGCFDNYWAPLLKDVDDFALSYRLKSDLKNYSVIVIGVAVWDAAFVSWRGNHERWAKGWRAKPALLLRTAVNRTIYNIYQNILLPSSSDSAPLVVWRTAGWGATWPWTPNETVPTIYDNFRIHVINDEAKKIIRQLNHSKFVCLDWGREILPYSFREDRFKAEDYSPYHYGLEGRLHSLQLLAQTIRKERMKHNVDLSRGISHSKISYQVTQVDFFNIFSILSWLSIVAIVLKKRSPSKWKAFGIFSLLCLSGLGLNCKLLEFESWSR